MAALKQTIDAYLEVERQPVNLFNCRKAVADNDLEALEAHFGKRITFGTAGLRGPMDYGISCMNSATVLQAGQGLCKYYLNLLGEEECKGRCMVVGYDGRYNSRYFAHLTAAIFMSKGIRVLMTDKVTATPITPFLVVKHDALCGVQVTASHNPKIDNGYKVYGSNGAQIIPPMDKEVHNLILSEQKQWDGVEQLMLHHPHCCLNSHAQGYELWEDPFPGAWEDYKETIFQDLKLSSLEKSSLKVVYTAMHGVGYEYINDMIVGKLSYPKDLFIPVREQMWPDPEFSTVVFPNPEEAGALDLAMATADHNNARMVIANDPDADRFAASEKQADGKWYTFTGDELGSLFGAMAFEKWHGVAPPKSLLFVCSAVSSKFLAALASSEGCRFEETMTGFKWMMNTALTLREKEDMIPIFAYEEALGYGLTMSVPDKDGVSAASLWLEKASELYAKGMTMSMWLDELSKKYGYFATSNSYYVCNDPAIMSDIFKSFRDGGYPSAIGSYKISRIRDLAVNYDSVTLDKKTTFPPTSSDMLTIFFENGSHITWRGSGTEPKLKYYSEMRHPSSKKEAKEELVKVVDAVCAHLLGKRPLMHATEYAKMKLAKQ